MNASHNTSISPNTFRRLLTAHGRTTTPGVFDATVTYNPGEIMEEVNKKKKVTELVKDPAEAPEKENKKLKSVDSERIVAKYVVENFWPPKGDLINPPLSKMRSPEPIISSSYSFYTRPFKVHGKEAWEFAMRGLGSVDTLLNRYGYVDPMWRKDMHPSPAEGAPKNAARLKLHKEASSSGETEPSLKEVSPKQGKDKTKPAKAL